VAGRPVTFFGTLVALFVAAVAIGRFLLTGTPETLVVFAIACPLVIVALARFITLPGALVVTAVFVLVVLASRSILVDPRAGWVPFLLVPVAALITAFAVSVVRALTLKSKGVESVEEKKEGEKGSA
jgi:hypothetical protein